MMLRDIRKITGAHTAIGFTQAPSGSSLNETASAPLAMPVKKPT